VVQLLKTRAPAHPPLADIHAQNHGGDPEAVRLGPRALGRLDQEGRKRLSTAA